MSLKTNHRTLEVDPASKQCKVRSLEEKIVKDYIGGPGLGMKILYDEVGPEVNPLSPDNILFIAPGPLSGTEFGFIISVLDFFLDVASINYDINPTDSSVSRFISV